MSTCTEGYTAIRALSWVGPMFWYSYIDRGTNASDSEDWFGLLRADGSRRPAYDAYKSLPR